MSFKELLRISKYLTQGAIVTTIARNDSNVADTSTTISRHGQQAFDFENSK